MSSRVVGKAGRISWARVVRVEGWWVRQKKEAARAVAMLSAPGGRGVRGDEGYDWLMDG